MAHNILDMYLKIPKAFRSLSFSSLLLIAFVLAERYYIFGILTVSLFTSLVELIILLICLIKFILAIICFFRNYKSKKLYMLAPLFIFIASLAVFFNLSIFSHTPDNNFKKHFTDYNEVVNMVMEGKIKTYETDTAYGFKHIELPLRYRYLSIGGEIWVDENNGVFSIFFKSTSDFLEERFSGYVFRSNSKEPSEEIFGKSFTKLEKVKDCWFWKD